MSRNRARQRQNRREKAERLNLRNDYGVNDPTPRDAVNNIIREKKKEKHS